MFIFSEKVLSVDKLTMVKLHLVFVSVKKKGTQTGFYSSFLSLRQVFAVWTQNNRLKCVKCETQHHETPTWSALFHFWVQNSAKFSKKRVDECGLRPEECFRRHQLSHHEKLSLNQCMMKNTALQIVTALLHPLISWGFLENDLSPPLQSSPPHQWTE